MSKKVSSKSGNITIDTRELSNSRSWQDFLDKETLAIYCGKDEWRERLIHTMYKWSERPASLEVLQFCMEYKIPYMTLREWERKYPDIGEAYKNMKLNIACHRRLGSMNKKLDGAYAYKDMHCYDPEWLAINKYHSEMKKDEEKQSHTFVINTSKPHIISKQEMAGESDKE